MQSDDVILYESAPIGDDIMNLENKIVTINQSIQMNHK